MIPLLFGIYTSGYSTVINIPADCLTIQQGIDASVSGDTVLVETGIYYENLVISGHDLLLASHFIFDGNPLTIENTVIDGGGVNTAINMHGAGFFTMEVSGFSVTNGYWYGNWPDVRGGGIHADDSIQVKIRNCHIYNNRTTGYLSHGGGIYINSSNSIISDCALYGNESTMGPAIAVGERTDNVLIEDCVIYNNACAVSNPANLSIISIRASSNITVSRSIIHHNGGTGIWNYGSGNTSVIHCTIANNSGFGINNIYYDSDIYVLNSISAFNYMGNLLNSDNLNSVAVCEYSDIINGTGQAWFNQGCIDMDPFFEDTLQNNYNLMEGSPCVDSGDPESPLDPDGTRADMGALYFDQSTGLDEKGNLPEYPNVMYCYPNPFNASTTFRYFLNSDSEIIIEIFNILGQRVDILSGGMKKEGAHAVNWNAGSEPSGVYFARISTGGETASIKMVLMK